MKIIYAALLLMFVSSCASNDPMMLSFSPVFKLVVNSKEIGGSTIFYSDELSIKTKDNKLISAIVLSSDFEKLPDEFDIRSYPAYLLGIEDLEENISTKKEFSNTMNSMKHLYDFDSVKVVQNEGVTFYTTCGLENCLGYVVKDDFRGHILSIRSSETDQQKFTQFIIGAVDVK